MEDPPRLSHVFFPSLVGYGVPPPIPHPPRGGPHCRSTSIRDTRSPRLLTSRVVPQPTSGCSSRYVSPSAAVTPQPDPSVSSPSATWLPRRPAGTATESHAWPHLTETVAGGGRGGLSQLMGDPQARRGASQASPRLRHPLESPCFNIYIFRGDKGRRWPWRVEPLCAVTPGHRCGCDAPEGFPQGDRDVGPTPRLSLALDPSSQPQTWGLRQPDLQTCPA